MNKYNEIEIQTAKNLMEQGYKWIYRTSLGTLYAYQTKPRHYDSLCKSYVPIFQSVKSCDEPVSLESIVHPQILDDAERRYLSAVIRPFRDSVRGIEKAENLPYEMICIDTKYRYMVFPPFDKGTMYKGMKTGWRYTLEELGL